MFSVKSLESAALNSAVAYLIRWEKRPESYTNEELMEVIMDFRRYCASVEPFLLPRVAEYGSFQSYKKLATLFLSSLVVKKKKMKLYDCYRPIIVDLIVDYGLLDSGALRRVSELFIEVNFTHKRELLFSKFPHLKKFRIEKGLTDETLESLAKHCPELSVLDDSEDEICSVTDNGLQQLARLKKLKYVLFHTAKYLDVWEVHVNLRIRFTGYGVALLMTQLPILIKITCPNIVMRGALDQLQFSASRLLTVRSLDLGSIHLRSNVLLSISHIICPNLERMEIYVREDEDDLVTEQLDNVTSLTELHVEFCEELRFPFNIGVVGNRLLVLDFENIYINSEIMSTMSGQCPNVQYLSIGGICSGDSPSLGDCLGSDWPLLFPRLETLDFHCEDLSCLYFFMHRSSNLRYVICNSDNNPFVLEGLEHEHGIWPNVVAITLRFMNDLPDDINTNVLARQLVEALPSLERIHVSNVRDDEGMVLTSSRGNSVRMMSNYNVVFLLERPEYDRLDFLR